MQLNHLLHCRLINQQLVKPKFKDPKDLVAHMGAIQSQDYAMAKWGIGLRLKNATDETIGNAINKGDILRTHVMRPIWHFVSPEDIRWMVALTAPQINKITVSMYRALELDDKILQRTDTIIQNALKDNKHLTRKELMAEVAKAGIKVNSLRGIHIMFRAELDAIVCNGIKRNKQFTYALMDERVPMTKKITRDESIVKLAKIYFTSHAPATLQDFAWWSGLPVTDARIGLESIKSKLISEKIEDDIYWMADSYSFNSNLKSIHLLPCYDEFTVSYKNRSASFEMEFSKKMKTTWGGILNPVMVVNGKVIGTWKRIIKKNSVEIQLKPFGKLNKSLHNDIVNAANRYGKFLGLTVNLKK